MGVSFSATNSEAEYGNFNLPTKYLPLFIPVIIPFSPLCFMVTLESIFSVRVAMKVFCSRVFQLLLSFVVIAPFDFGMLFTLQ